jgi:hypothetical protein
VSRGYAAILEAAFAGARNGTLRRIGTEIFGAAIDELPNVEAGDAAPPRPAPLFERTRQTA